ncbi:MAG TPA: TaqI-like C-terminal specificity domain-containing protein, partial [Chitinophagaceae bacterium]|nr:TaqI-like C-terminal specificity domain-containing protein [Chitinophagaceae bacterium]
EKPESRRNHIQEKFSKVPYLNSSLFERIELERQTINVSELDNRLQLPLANTTVLKDDKGKRKTGTLPTLQYLFEFLDAYDFTSEGGEEIQEENKNLINASVLGLIFEKINGYKDGSFFTPGFVTMYMCKETIRRSVLQKFNDTKGWSCDTLDSLYNKIDDKKEANKIINSLHICDPAVGSGHFLVSALNEMIAIKSELKILQDAAGKSLRDYHVEVVNDELIITDEDGKLFDYNPQNKESQRIQETLFHEKETIIENCLFGVDINPNSVKICRLRLWIELLKNAYYTPASNYTELETLPNIDINIKCGNSLISRFALDADIKSALRNSKWSIDSYKVAVQTYRDAESKEQKREMEELIDAIKKDFRSYISPNDPKYKKLSKLRGDLFNLSQTKELFDEGNKKSKDTKKKIEQLSNEITKLETEIGEIKNNAIYENAFEWRFEFPEVLNDEGDYVGFDLIIGNPPYVFGGNEGISIKAKELFKEAFKSGSGKINLFTLFIEQSFRLLKNSGNFSFIIPNTFLRVTSYDESRRLLIQNHKVYNIYDFGNSVFEDAITTAVVIIASKETSDKNHEILINNNGVLNSIKQNEIADSNYLIALNIDPQKKALIEKLKKTAIDLGSICDELIFGVVITMNKDEVVSKIPKPGWKPFLEGRDIGAYYIKPIHSYLNYSPNLLHRARTKKIFEAPEKLIIQRITGGNQPLKVAYDNNKYYNKESINNIILKEDCLYNVKYILALLNSKLLNWFYTNQFTNESKLTVNLSKEYLSQLPIYKATKGEQENIILLVEKILELKRNDFNTDTSAFERRIDLLVFKLYGLNENEIKIVNGIK